MTLNSHRSLVVSVFLAAIIAAISFLLFELTTALISCALGWAMLANTLSDIQDFIIPDDDRAIALLRNKASGRNFRVERDDGRSMTVPLFKE